MRQSGFLAAAGIVAIDKMIDRLEIDHLHAYKVAKGKSYEPKTDRNNTIISLFLFCLQL